MRRAGSAATLGLVLRPRRPCDSSGSSSLRLSAQIPPRASAPVPSPDSLSPLLWLAALPFLATPAHPPSHTLSGSLLLLLGKEEAVSRWSPTWKYN